MPVEHVAHAEQVRSEVVVAGVDAKVWFETQVVRLAQTRLVVVVAATVSNCKDEHTVNNAHTRSMVVVGGMVWNCALVQVVTGTQTRSVVKVGGVNSN